MFKLRPLPLLPLIVLMAITFFSIITLYSACAGKFFPWCSGQLWRVLLGIISLIVMTNIKFSVWTKYGFSLYLVCLLALIAVEVMGKISMGAQRWLKLGTLTLQPAEFMRIFLIMVLAKYFSIHTIDDNRRTKTLLIPALLTLIPVSFVLLQPDLGTAMLLILVFLSILFACGVQMWKFLMMFAGTLICTPILWSCLYDYQKRRILMFLNPEMDPCGAGYHIIQSKIALGSGGIWGKGFLNGTQCQLNFLPEKHTDFILAAFAEEFGFIGCLALCCLYAIILAFNFNVALLSRNKFSQIMVFGLSAMMFFYIVINIAMVCGLLPVVGIPLPFLSYGGSALITLMACQGIIFSAYYEQQNPEKI